MNLDLKKLAKKALLVFLLGLATVTYGWIGLIIKRKLMAKD